MVNHNNISKADVLNIMGRVWGIPVKNIPLDVKFGDLLEWDSMGHVVLLASLEAEYDIEINYEILTKLTSMEAIIMHFKKRISNVG